MNAVYGHTLSHKAPGGGLGLRKDCHTPTLSELSGTSHG